MKTWAKKRFRSHAEKRSQNMESLQQTLSFLKRYSKPFLKPCCINMDQTTPVVEAETCGLHPAGKKTLFSAAMSLCREMATQLPVTTRHSVTTRSFGEPA